MATTALISAVTMELPTAVATNNAVTPPMATTPTITTLSCSAWATTWSLSTSS